MSTPREFGPGLKALRERGGITLEAIAQATKIGVPLLADLERNDVSRWPKGIFRRAFFRDYATAIGAPVDETLTEFLRLFPESGGVTLVSEAPAALRMTLAAGHSRTRMQAIRAGAALLDMVSVVAAGLPLAWLIGAEWTTAVAAVALLYYPLTTALLGRGLALSWLNDGTRAPAAWRSPRAPARELVTTAVTPAETAPDRRRPQHDRRSGADRRGTMMVRPPRFVMAPTRSAGTVH